MAGSRFDTKGMGARRMAALAPETSRPGVPMTEDTPPILILPGLYNSEPDHWQSHWEQAIPGARRVDQEDWERPDLADWTSMLLEAVRERPGAILVAHSLGCAAICHLNQITQGRRVGGALMVAPADVNQAGPNASQLRGFSPIPLARLPFPTTVVASRNDPYVQFERAQAFARGWGSQFVDLGQAGHINVAAGYGPWPEGLDHLQQLIERVRAGA